MKRFAKVLSLAAVAILLAVSCKGSGGGGAAAASAASVFPKDTGVVFGFSVTKFRTTELWETAKTLAAKGGKELDEFKELCDIDAMTAVDSLVVAIPADENEKKIAMLINGKVGEAKAIECANKMAKKSEGEFKVEKSGKIVAFIDSNNPDKGGHASWLSDSSMLFTAGGKEFIESLLAGKDSLKGNADMMAMMNKVDTSATIWGVASLKSGPAAKAVRDMPFEEKPTAGYGSLDYTKSLSLKVALVFASDAGAKSAADALNAQLDQQKSNPMVGQFIKDLKIAASGKETIVSLKMSEDQLKQLTAMIKQFLPMMGM